MESVAHEGGSIGNSNHCSPVFCSLLRVQRTPIISFLLYSLPSSSSSWPRTETKPYLSSSSSNDLGFESFAEIPSPSLRGRGGARIFHGIPAVLPRGWRTSSETWAWKAPFRKILPYVVVGKKGSEGSIGIKCSFPDFQNKFEYHKWDFLRIY